MELELKIKFDSLDEMRNFIGTKEAVLEVKRDRKPSINLKPLVLKCANCSKPFHPKRKDSMFCSKECANNTYQKRYAEKRKKLPSDPLSEDEKKNDGKNS